MSAGFKIDRIEIKNFRSIAECEIYLNPLTFFVGPNGSGKTNVVDALSFVADGLRHSLEKAIRDRKGIDTILHLYARFPAVMAFCFDISSSTGLKCRYSLEVRVEQSRSVSVSREECRVRESGDREHYYLVREGTVEGSSRVLPAVSRDRLFLVNASGLPEFRVIYDFLSSIRIREAPFGRLSFDTEYELVTRFRDLIGEHADQADVVQEYLRAIVPRFDRIEPVEIDNKWALQFVDKSTGSDRVAFSQSQTSAGLLNAASILLDLFEPSSKGLAPSVVILEEPEALLQPSAIAVLRDSFFEASASRQVLVTSHSVELLNDSSIPADSIRVVYQDETGTHARPLDNATVSILRDQLFTAGELLRQGGLI
jgi:predicted ATPase